VTTRTRIGLVGALSALFVIGATGIAVAKPTEVSTKKYAKTVCGVYTDIPKNIEDFTSAYNTAPTSDPTAFQTSAVTITSDLLDNLGQLQAKLKKVYPDVDDGKKISKIFVNDVQEYLDEISKALTKFKAADPNGAAFVGDQATFETEINVLSATTVSDPFSKVHDQDLLGALDKEKSCKKVVTIYGG
jgi:hypothetical protein